MNKFNVETTIEFEAVNIIAAKERLKDINQIMNNYNINIKISKNERLFSEGDLK